VGKKYYTAESVHWFLVYLLVLVTPFSIYPVVVSGARGLKPFLFVAILIILVCFVRLCYGEAVRLNAATKSVLFFCGVALFSLVGFVVAHGTWSGLLDYGTKFIQLFVSAGLVVSASTLRVSEKNLRRLMYVLLGISAVVSIYALYQSLARIYEWPFAYLTIYNPSLSPEEGATTRGGQFGTFIRPSAFFQEPSRLGQFLLTPTLVSFFLYISASRRWNRMYFLTALILTASAFVLAFSMGAYIGMGAAIGVGLLMREVRKYSIRVVLGSMGILFVLSFLFYPVLGYSLVEMISVRALAHLQVFGIGEAYSQSPFGATSVGNRLARAQEGFQVWWNHPLLGVGLNNYGYFYSSGVVPYLHSAFLQSLAEMGILGGVSFLTLILMPALALLNKINHIAGWRKGCYLGVGLGLVGRLVWMVFAGNYIIEFFWIDMLLATLLISYS